jgi:tetratricopeptide (TPR) repeat protein
MAMASRDNAAALRAYSTLASRNQKSAPLLVDLGRVHEAMGTVPKAVESYRQASQVDSENPAPFLRLGILSGRAGDRAASEAAFKRAEELYSARGRVEGVAAVSYERGVMLDRVDRTTEAMSALQRALKLAESVDSAYLRSSVLFKLSSIAGYAGRIEEAERQAREALRLGEPFDGLKAFGLVDLGNAFIYRKQLDVAEQHFRQAVDIAGRAGASRSEARARLALGALLVRVGSVTDAMAEAKAAFDYYNQTGFVAQRTRAQTVIAQAQARTGDLAGAQASYEALLKTAVDGGNEGQIAEQHNSLTSLLLQREEYVAALRHSDESLSRYRTLKAPYDVMHATLLRADILCQLGRLDEADRELEAMFTPNSGMGKPTPAGEQSRAVRRSQVMLARNENARAVSLVRSALAASTEVTGATRAGLYRLLVLGLTRSGRPAEALTELDAAKVMNDDSVGPVGLAQTALVRSEALYRLRRFEEALTEVGPLVEKLSAAGLHESAWLAARLAAQSAASLGQADVAARWQGLANEHRTRFIAQFDSAGLATYESRRDVKLRL